MGQVETSAIDRRKHSAPPLSLHHRSMSNSAALINRERLAKTRISWGRCFMIPCFLTFRRRRSAAASGLARPELA